MRIRLVVITLFCATFAGMSGGASLRADGEVQSLDAPSRISDRDLSHKDSTAAGFLLLAPLFFGIAGGLLTGAGHGRIVAVVALVLALVLVLTSAAAWLSAMLLLAACGLAFDAGRRKVARAIPVPAAA